MWNHFFYERKCIMKPLRNQRQHVFVTALAMALCLVCAGPAAAQIGFEPPDYDGSADGVILTGQQGWYVPPVTGSSDVFVFTYDGNALQLPANAYGDTQFIGGATLPGAINPRAQWDYDWNQASVWTVSYDICGQWAGSGPPIDYLGSFSLQDSTVARYFIAVNSWADMTGNFWRANYIIFNAAGVQQNPQLADPNWDNLQVKHWYNQSVTFDFDQNLILSVSISDLDTGDTATAYPDSWYLAGGANPTQPLPTGLRFFVGGGQGNVLGFDNLVITPGGDYPVRGPRTKSISVPTDPSAVTD
jgi:hypothetical protein